MRLGVAKCGCRMAAQYMGAARPMQVDWQPCALHRNAGRLLKAAYDILAAHYHGTSESGEGYAKNLARLEKAVKAARGKK